MGKTQRHKRRGQPPGYRPPAADDASIRDRALARSKQLRKERAAIRQGIKLGRIDGVLLIAGHYDELEVSIRGWRLDHVLRSVPKIGPVRCAEILRVMGRPPHTKLGKDLTFAERKQLAELVREAKEVVIGVL